CAIERVVDGRVDARLVKERALDFTDQHEVFSLRGDRAGVVVFGGRGDTNDRLLVGGEPAEINGAGGIRDGVVRGAGSLRGKEFGAHRLPVGSDGVQAEQTVLGRGTGGSGVYHGVVEDVGIGRLRGDQL